MGYSIVLKKNETATMFFLIKPSLVCNISFLHIFVSHYGERQVITEITKIFLMGHLKN